MLPVLGEYADAGHREAQDKLAFSLKANAKYYAIYLLAGISGIIYFFLSFGASPTSLKGVLMALAYCWGLVLAIYLMGHGLVAIPRSCFKKYSVAGRLRNIESRASRLHEKMEDAIQDLEHLEAQVAELAKRTTGSVANFRDWIADLVDDARLSESTQLLSTRQGSVPGGSVPRIITEGYLADLSRQLCRARHSRARYVDEWEHLLYEHVYYETILKSTDTKTITLGRASPHSSFLDRFTVHTPYSRYLWRYWVVPYLWLALGAFLSLCSFCIVVRISAVFLDTLLIHASGPKSSRRSTRTCPSSRSLLSTIPTAVLARSVS